MFCEQEGLTIVDRMMSVDLLALDDIGMGYMSDWCKSVFEEIVRGRYERKKSMIVTTNMSIRELAKTFGESAINVLSACTSLVPCEGHDWREKERG